MTRRAFRFQADRGLFGVRTGPRGAAGARDRAYREQPAADPGGRAQLRVAPPEIAAAARALAVKAAAGALDPREIDEKAIAAGLQTDGLPDLDLLIRTSGEIRPLQFPVVAGGLFGAFVRRHLVAGFR